MNLLISLVGYLMIIFVTALARLAVSWQAPALWTQNAARAYPDLNPAIDPPVMAGVISFCG